MGCAWIPCVSVPDPVAELPSTRLHIARDGLHFNQVGFDRILGDFDLNYHSIR